MQIKTLVLGFLASSVALALPNNWDDPKRLRFPPDPKKVSDAQKLIVTGTNSGVKVTGMVFASLAKPHQISKEVFLELESSYKSYYLALGLLNQPAYGPDIFGPEDKKKYCGIAVDNSNLWTNLLQNMSKLALIKSSDFEQRKLLQGFFDKHQDGGAVMEFFAWFKNTLGCEEVFLDYNKFLFSQVASAWHQHPDSLWTKGQKKQSGRY